MLAAAPLLLLTLLLAIACGEGDKEQDGPPVAGSPTASDISAVDLRQELETLSAAWAGNSAKVTYDFTSSTRQDITETGSMTVYWGPPDWRMDVSGFSTASLFALDEDCDCHLAVSELEETTLIVTADNTFRCTAAEDGAGRCMSVDTHVIETVSLPFLEDLIKPEAFSRAIAEAVGDADIDRSTEQIADQEAICYTVVATTPEQSGESEWCFGPDGLLLRLAGTYSDTDGSGSFHLNAITVTREVSDADFQPPYPLT